ncbi:MAG: hypothetical protein SFY95_04030 [Planctomycetota bacterium]|nr:hypothetical protein [Planctomycetota bacterium]
MAGRTSTSVGMGVFLTILIVVSLTFIVLSMVFYAQASDAKRQLASTQSEVSEIIRPDERNRDDIRAFVDQAKRSQPPASVVGFLAKNNQDLMEKVTGVRRLSMADFQKRLTGIDGAANQNLLELISSRDNDLASLTQRLAEADAARQAALADLKNESERVKAIEASHQATVDGLNGEIGRYKAEVETYRAGSDKYRADLDARLARAQSEAGAREAALSKQVENLSNERLVLLDQLARLRGEKNKDLLKAADEFALVDARIISVNATERTVSLDIGRNRKVVLGMTFAAYADAGAIRPDPKTGEYPAGKATLEVINVGDSTATARITSEARGNPVVRGDVVANAVFDPNKSYKFLVFGNFDSARTGVATPSGQDDIKALLKGWNGSVVDELSGDVDFLVLGERPVLPPRPGVNAPIEVQRFFIEQDRVVKRYDQLLQQATALAIPVLNENRLYTLIGKTPATPRTAAR